MGGTGTPFLPWSDLRNVAMSDPHARGRDTAERAAQALRNHHRAMPTASAANRNRQIALPLRDVERDDVSHVLLEAIHEGARPAVALHELHARAVASGPAAERRGELRIRQAPRVEHEVRVDRQTVLEPEAEDGNDETRARTLARQAHEELPELVDRHVRGVDDLVREIADDVQPRPLVANALADRPV